MRTLTEKDVAVSFRCSVAALRRMRREGRGPRWTRVGRLVRYPEEWLREYVEQNAATLPTPAPCTVQAEILGVSNEMTETAQKLRKHGVGPE